MDPMTAAIIGVITGITSLIGAVTIWVKTKTESERMRQARAETAKIRDKDSLDMHDAILKLQFQATANKDNIQLLFDLNKDNVASINTLNTQLATVLTKIDTIIETLNEIKDKK